MNAKTTKTLMALGLALAVSVAWMADAQAQAVCGDGVCQPSESCSKCLADCDGPLLCCGNGKCDSGESCVTCSTDCGACGSCGDGYCDPTLLETCSTCPSDCGNCNVCGDGLCIAPGGGGQPGDETCTTCTQDCGACAVCGDAICDHLRGETCSSCTDDCGACPVCGDAMCDAGESCGTCPADCICTSNFERKPLILILFDTSGSMEYTPLAGENIPICDNASLTNCAYSPPHVGHTKSRTIVAKEVLTGRFDDANYMCCGIPRSSQEPDPDLPFHYEVHMDVPQAVDGIMDVYREDVRFGLMTYDANYLGSVGVDGGWSMGPSLDSWNVMGESNLTPLTWNWGAKNSQANRGYHGYNNKIIRSTGALVAVPANEDSTLMAEQNDDLQEEVRWLFPYGRETPLAALIDDARDYILDEENIQLDPCLKDIPTAVILITDGHPSFDACWPSTLDGEPSSFIPPAALSSNELYDMYGDGITTGGDCNAWYIDGKRRVYPWWYYQTSERMAAKLWDTTGFRTFVIGFMTGEASDQKLRKIAHAGKTCTDLNAPDCYMLADGYESLYLAYDAQITTMLNLSGIRAKTHPVTTLRTSFRETDVGMYEVSARFKITNRLWRGELERVTFTCDTDGNLVATDFVEFSKQLGAMQPSARRIFAGSEGLDPGATPPLLEAECSNIPNCNSDLVDFLYGPGQFDGKPPLGDIQHSNPTIAVGPELDLNIPSYQAFRRAWGGRDTTLYVGSGDGMLHAFTLADLAEPVETEGTEKWAFIPRGVQDKLSLLPIAHQKMVDGTPLIKDVRMYRDLEKTPAEKWSTVLVGHFRSGGRGYFALDVTDPDNPTFLWELNAADCTSSDPQKCLNQPELYRPYRRLGYTYSKPTVGTIMRDKGDGTLYETAVAILPGGLSSGQDLNEGEVIYVVDLNDGTLLRTFTKLADETPLQQVPGSPVAHSTFPGTVMSRAFVADKRSVLMRIDLTSPDPALWFIEEFWNPVADGGIPTWPEPVMFPPALARDRNGDLVIVFGTGDINDLAPVGGRVNFVASVTEERNYDVDTGAISYDPKQNWNVYTTDGSKLTGEPLIFNNVAYFATLHAPPPDPKLCQTPFARLHGVHFKDTESGLPKKVIDFDEDGTLDDYLEFGSNTVVFGVEVTARPACIEKVDLGNGTYGFAGAKSSKPQLVVQTSGKPFAAGTTPPSNISTNNMDAGEVIDKVRIDVPPPPTSLKALSWVLVYQ